MQKCYFQVLQKILSCLLYFLFNDLWMTDRIIIQSPAKYPFFFFRCLSFQFPWGIKKAEAEIAAANNHTRVEDLAFEFKSCISFAIGLQHLLSLASTSAIFSFLWPLAYLNFLFYVIEVSQTKTPFKSLPSSSTCITITSHAKGNLYNWCLGDSAHRFCANRKWGPETM